MSDQQYHEDVMFASLEVFYKHSPIKAEAVWENHLSNHTEFPLFKRGDVINSIASHAKNLLAQWDASDGNYTDKTYNITEKGKTVYIIERDRRNRYREEKELQFKKLKHDQINTERVYKTYGTTRIITWVTFFVMLILSFLKLAEVLHIWPYHK